ncbi:MAG: type 4a pilus biogenesis protein PilO [Vicinamibacteria bacterium]|jgi:type IV pilus assembly protein PilO|nr:type 4a pilus biogenesis protein PilO [Vicinamibacteria bacterium]
MAENPLTKLPLAGQAGVGLAALIVIVGAFYYIQYEPMSVELAQKSKDLEDLRAEIKQLEVAAARQDELKKELAQLEARLQVMSKYLPASKETPQIIRAVQLLAYSSTLSVTRFTPSPTVQKDFYLEAPIQIGLTGTYHNLARFFDSVSRLPRLVNVGKVTLRNLNKQTDTQTVTAAITATSYVYQEAPAKAPAKGKGKR